MAAYMAMAHIVSARPHRPGTPVAEAIERPLAGVEVQVAEVDDERDLLAGLADRWWSLRERWSQATFFLFDPESWR